jgi:2-dehydro-3-deoxygalactonokinase
MIGVDWGTSTFRAYRLDRDGTILARHENAQGIMRVANADFADALTAAIGSWFALGEDRVLLAGMIGSRQGWHEVPYLRCPAGPGELACGLAEVRFPAARVKLIPGLATVDAAGVPEVMRGEETQIAGLVDRIGGSGVACLPGTHSKWARIEAGRVSGFTTYLTGETFAALCEHTILGRMMRRGGGHVQAAFDRGLARAATAGSLLHHLFGVRTLGLFDELSEDDAASYLSGLLIGHELQAALPEGALVHLIGAPELCGLYARAIEAAGGRARIEDEDAAARGLGLIGGLAQWT